MRQPFLDPFPWRCLEDLVATAAQAFEFFFQGVDFSFCIQESLSEGATAAPLANKIDEVREATLLGGELRLFEPHGFRDVGVELPDLLLDAPEDVVDRFRGGEPRGQLFQDDLFDERSADQQLVLAGPLRGRDAAIVAAGFAADLGHIRAAGATDDGAGQQMRREVVLATSLRGGEATVSFSTRPAAADLLSADAHDDPQLLGDDAERFVDVDNPVRFGLRKLAAPSGARIATGFALVPRPAADVFLVIQEAADGGGGPAFACPHPSRDGILIEHPDDADH